MKGSHACKYAQDNTRGNHIIKHTYTHTHTTTKTHAYIHKHTQKPTQIQPREGARSESDLETISQQFHLPCYIQPIRTFHQNHHSMCVTVFFFVCFCIFVSVYIRISCFTIFLELMVFGVFCNFQIFIQIRILFQTFHSQRISFISFLYTIIVIILPSPPPF